MELKRWIISATCIIGLTAACAAQAFRIGDVNKDGVVSGADLSVVIGNFGKSVPPNTSGDVNGDGMVDASDLSVVQQSMRTVPVVKPTPPTPPPVAAPPAVEPIVPIAVHPSQRRINGPGYFTEISAGRFITSENPRGWASVQIQPNVYLPATEIERRGWWIYWPMLVEASKAGYTWWGAWEMSGQDQEIANTIKWNAANPTQQKPCRMAYFSESTISDSWTPVMKDTFIPFVDAVQTHLHMRVMPYTGSWITPNFGTSKATQVIYNITDAHIQQLVNDLAWMRTRHIDIVGLDTYSYLQHVDPALAIQVIRAVRSDPRTADMTLMTEGWHASDAAPGKVLSREQRAEFLANFVGLELFRAPDPVSDDNWARIRQDELQLCPGRIGVALMHGWPRDKDLPAYDKIRAYNFYVLDWKIPRPALSPGG